VSETVTDKGTTGVPIELENVTKRYSASSTGLAAVDDLTMSIPAGKIVVLLGPSGCGKTTTMRLINRLIEPTSGRIMIGDTDARAQEPNELRRGIGYVIQQAGLFPHMTVGTNISQVPQMLGWDKQRITTRVDELLDLVGLDSGQFRDRYPRQLSGGQQQRVGVARALAADPSVLLMDEPFGALDPITRERLQDELLRLQEELGKTIVFVTHDIDEALRIGDQIAILDKGSRIAQYASPAEILANPASEYVEQFIGSGSAMRLLNFAKVADVELGQVAEVAPGDEVTRVRETIAGADTAYALVVDAGRRPTGWVTSETIDGRDGTAGELSAPIETTIPARATLQEAMEGLLHAEYDVVPVTKANGEYLGVVSLGTIQQELSDLKERQKARRQERVSAGGDSA
jgi:osmoprotectant transport system ATP-binding protein